VSAREPIRSYQRIFRPERRIYQVEGHRLPVPGGVPLRWVGYFLASLLAVIALSGRSPLVAALAAAVAAGGGWVAGRAPGALAAGSAAFVAAQLVGLVLSGLDWPLRLAIVPALLATVGTQATPDGRVAHRYAISWLALQLRPARRSLGRPLPPSGETRRRPAAVWVAGDSSGSLRRGRVTGPARVTFAAPLAVRRRGRRLVATPTTQPESVAAGVDLAAGERLEVRP